ncbi:MAG: hypothetical protein ABJC64_13315, partial [Paracoccaceae bacterium]
MARLLVNNSHYGCFIIELREWRCYLVSCQRGEKNADGQRKKGPSAARFDANASNTRPSIPRSNKGIKLLGLEFPA